MALHKLNVLQWHLTDDQGWRLQIRKYPRLTSVGAWRAAARSGRPASRSATAASTPRRRSAGSSPTPRARHVTIVPEIEMPGHSLSAILAYPRARRGAGPTRRPRATGASSPISCDPSERTFALHGRRADRGDGAVSRPLDQRRRRRGGEGPVEGLAEGPGADQARWASPTRTRCRAGSPRRIGEFLAAHGRRMIGWDDILDGGDALPADAARCPGTSTARCRPPPPATTR